MSSDPAELPGAVRISGFSMKIFTEDLTFSFLVDSVGYSLLIP
jgi:hypothetical protein